MINVNSIIPSTQYYCSQRVQNDKNKTMTKCINENNNIHKARPAPTLVINIQESFP